MHESDLYKYLGAPAARERALQDILQVLEIRLHYEIAIRFKPSLERIEDLQHLTELHRAAMLAGSPDNFKKVLDEHLN